MTERLSLIVNEAMLRLATLDLRREEGQGVTEYGIALGFVAVVVAGLLLGLGDKISAFFQTVGTDLGHLPDAI
jgi:Flp pilus assembly pilin Flp